MSAVAVRERPILMNGPMIRAILDGRKTMTRRPVIRQQQIPNDWQSWSEDAKTAIIRHRCPFGIPGDRLIPAMEIPSLGRNYCADTYGAIWSRARDGATWKRMKGSPTSKGYHTITPTVDGKYRTQLVHRLVCEAFYGPPPKGKNQVRHLNGITQSNSPENLDWGSQEDNWTDRIVHGGGCRETHHNSKLTDQQVDKIRAFSRSLYSQRELARRFKVSQSTIWSVLKGNTWAFNPKPNPLNFPRWASRITLEVTGVRVERVQEIAWKDAIAEGVFGNEVVQGMELKKVNGSKEAIVRIFSTVWDSLNAKRGYGWDANPFVWVIEFRRIQI